MLDFMRYDKKCLKNGKARENKLIAVHYHLC